MPQQENGELYLVDHRNHNKLDLSKDNLRLATFSQNQHNRKKGLGYYFDKREKKYKAQIGYKGKTIHIGYFEIAADASAAYNKKRRELFGDFYHDRKNN